MTGEQDCKSGDIGNSPPVQTADEALTLPCRGKGSPKRSLLIVNCAHLVGAVVFGLMITAQISKGTCARIQGVGARGGHAWL